ncbi:Sulfite exporter TauE/SafE [Limihaloglobus sulfuriphilus]|uniref:Probable membrane transporter protein n=1 Tax=Limihaloglobus sulfuriphilus TaxID=1851148 RepID=A0A1Q2MCJ8_9BACT|nr:sulfite exporter TauE/SafE family protein [Limihaloglobus sulfuriphilus]AQQ69972.1 Sulfite exporter TauE/SafE [Limihaloglobus sulfuriphilus]
MDFNAFIITGSILLGLIIGILTGIFGVGGGFILTPALMILLGVPGGAAVGTGIATILANSTIGLIKRKGSGSVDVKVAGLMSGGCIAGALIGSAILENLKGVAPVTINGHHIPAVQLFLLLMFMALLIFIGVNFLVSYFQNPGREAVQRGLLDKVRIPPYAHFETLDNRILSVPGLLVLGLAAGLMTGLLGIGGGVVLLPMLIYLVGQDGKEAAGTSLLLVWIASIVSVVPKTLCGDVSLVLFVLLFAGGFFGTVLGTKIGLALREDKIRFYFVFVIAAAIAMVGFKLYSLIWQ